MMIQGPTATIEDMRWYRFTKAHQGIQKMHRKLLGKIGGMIKRFDRHTNFQATKENEEIFSFIHELNNKDDPHYDESTESDSPNEGTSTPLE